ncbi:uncharacterized protein LOC115929732 [Strongylocentrotus purpuratus]|uniref:Uncharacterized protein n=1 Tax=Strongylocentrotus purpuratus TaxID=7668 RepID=A0A7M7PR43_STRPU|nr:uncharacterized protein LOC115929732 [Strongylocentrotus purpuratus]
MDAAALWGGKITGGYCNATADSRNGTACPFMVTITGFDNGSLVVHFTVVFESSMGSTLNAFNIQILDANGTPYGTTVSGVTLVCAGVTCVDCTSCSEATTPVTRIPGTLQCYSCSTNSITDVCSTADDLASGSGVLTPTCYQGQRCWTDHYENSSHTVVSRGCKDALCSDLHEDGPDCSTANGVTSCTSCCTESKCNDNKSSSEGLTSSCVTWLTSFFSMVIVLITYRT